MDLSLIPEEHLKELAHHIDRFNSASENTDEQVKPLCDIKDVLKVYFPQIDEEAVLKFVKGLDALHFPVTPPIQPVKIGVKKPEAVPKLNLRTQSDAEIEQAPHEARVPRDKTRAESERSLRQMLKEEAKDVPAPRGDKIMRDIQQAIHSLSDSRRSATTPFQSFAERYRQEHPLLTHRSYEPSLDRSPYEPSSVDLERLRMNIRERHMVPPSLGDSGALPFHRGPPIAVHPEFRQPFSARSASLLDRLRDTAYPGASYTPRSYMIPDMTPSSDYFEGRYASHASSRYAQANDDVDVTNTTWMNTEEKRFYTAMKEANKLEIQLAHANVIKSNVDTPLRFRLLLSDIPDDTKATIMKRLENMTGPHESAKYLAWLDTLLDVPFGTVHPLTVNMSSRTEEIADYLENCRKVLDTSVLGHRKLKDVLAFVVASWIRTDGHATTVNALGIRGPVGVGKTTIVRSGLSKATNRPFAFISCGGSSGGSLLSGHSFTYEGSLPGAVVNAIISSKCMNPIIMLDEVDKISGDPRGEEIFNTLLHLLDPSQNTEFQDRFLGIPLDISRAFFVLTYNDENKIPQVLRDRILEVEVSDFSNSDKVNIAFSYLLPDIFDGLHLDKGWLVIEDDAMQYIVDQNTSTGLRAVRHSLVNIVSALNMIALSGDRATRIIFASDADSQRDENQKQSDMREYAEVFRGMNEPPFRVSKRMVEFLMNHSTLGSSRSNVSESMMYC